MKKIIAALMLGSMLLIGFVSCQVYADDCSKVLVNNDGDVYDPDYDYNLNGLTGDDDTNYWETNDLDGDGEVGQTGDDEAYVSDLEDWTSRNAVNWDQPRD